MSHQDLSILDSHSIQAVSRHEVLRAVLICAVAVTVFLSPALLTGRFLSPSNMLFGYQPWQPYAPPDWETNQNGILFDGTILFEPWLHYSARRISEGTLPLWNPDNMLGAPFIGNLQSAVLHPPNWLFYLWPGGQTLALLAWVKLFTAALGMYFVARQVARVGPLGASIGALTFTFGSFMVMWLHNVAVSDVTAYLPWLWWATARLVESPGGRTVLLLAVIVALSLLAGHPGTIYHVTLATTLFALFQVWQVARRNPAVLLRRLAVWAAAYGLGVVLAAIQLLPFIEYLLFSESLAGRASRTPDLGLPLQFALTVFSPDWFGNPADGTWWPRLWNYNETNSYAGIIPLMLAPFALFAADRRQRRLVLFLIGVLLLALTLMYHLPVLHDLVGRLPGMSLVRNNRLILLLQFVLGLLAAVGFDAIWQHLPHARRRLALSLGGSVLALLAAGVVVPWLFASSYFELPLDMPHAVAVWQTSLMRSALLLIGVGALLATAIWLWSLRPRAARVLIGLLPLVLAADLWQAHIGYQPTVNPKDYFPSTEATSFLQAQPQPFRITASDHTLLQNTNLMYGLSDLRGYDAMEPQVYREISLGFEPGSAYEGSDGGMWWPFSGTASHLWNLFNVRYYIASPSEDPNYRISVAQEATTGDIVGEIIGQQTPGQIFVAQHDNLAKIQVLGATFGGKARGHLVFHLKSDPADPEDIVTRELDASRLSDDSYWTIEFPPIRGSAGKQLYFYFDSPDATSGSAPTLWYSKQDAYSQGTRTEGGEPVEGDLAFRVISAADADTLWFKKVLDGGDRAASIFENSKALPRAWLAHKAEVEVNPEILLHRMYSGDYDPENVVLLSTPLPQDLELPAQPPPERGLAAITSYEAETIDITTRSRAPGLLVLSDVIFPGWEAYVDGRPTQILTAFYALRAVYVPAGEHSVRFFYTPRSFQLGLVLTIIGLLVATALTIHLVWSSRQGRGQRADGLGRL